MTVSGRLVLRMNEGILWPWVKTTTDNGTERSKMIGLGTIINTAAIVAGGLLGRGCNSLLKERHQETITKAIGFAVIFMGAASTFSKMLVLSDAGNALDVTGTLNIVLSLALGALIGEIINIDALFERFGEWLKHKSGSDGDNQFVDAFVTASLTVSVGAMAIIGSIYKFHCTKHDFLTIKYHGGVYGQGLHFLRYSRLRLPGTDDSAGGGAGEFDDRCHS